MQANGHPKRPVIRDHPLDRTTENEIRMTILGIELPSQEVRIEGGVSCTSRRNGR